MTTFEARLYIQGVANFVPHPDRDKLLVLFPNQALFTKYKASFPRLPRNRQDPAGPSAFDNLCEHQPVVRMDPRQQSDYPDPTPTNAYVPNLTPWQGDFHGKWITIETDSQIPMELPKEGLPGTPSMSSVLASSGLTPEERRLDPEVLPTQGFLDPPEDLVAAGLYLDVGRISPVSDSEGPISFRPIQSIHGALGASRGEEIVAGVLKLELGMVSTFRLRIREFGKTDVATLDLRPIGDELNVVVRHECKKETLSQSEKDDAGEPMVVDTDFVLNYLLRADLPKFLAKVRDDMPMPRISTSWLRGGTIGGDLVQCMRVAETATPFVQPISE